jgi:hypothetical protein
MSQKPPAFQFYPRNWLTSRNVIRMSRGDRADYLHLLCHAWLSEMPGKPAHDAPETNLGDWYERQTGKPRPAIVDNSSNGDDLPPFQGVRS